MMYRAKITHCAPIIENIYGENYPYYFKDDKDLYIGVNSVWEWMSIRDIEYHQKNTFFYVQELQKTIEERNHD